MLEDFLHRFKTLVDTLMAHPQVRMTHSWIGPPATDEELQRLAKAWGRVPAAVETLYRQANGIQLRWIDTLCETYDPARDDVMRFAAPVSSLYSEPGECVGLFDLGSCDLLSTQESKTCGFIAAALRGGPTGFDTHRPAPHRGSSLGLSDFRLVRC